MPENAQQAEIAFDTETYPLGFVPKGESNPKTSRNQCPKLVCLSYHDGEETELIKPDEAVERWLAWLDSDSLVIGHNLAFDMAVMVRAARERGFEPMDAVLSKYADGEVRDTYIRQKLLDIATTTLYFRRGLNGYGLDDLGEYHIDVEYEGLKHGDDSWRTKYNELDPWSIDQWPDEACEYARLDAEVTYRVYQSQKDPKKSRRGKKISGGDVVVNEKFQNAAAFALHLQSVWGLAVDEDRAYELGDKYRTRLEELREDLARDGLYSDGTMNQDEKRAVFRRAWEQTDVDSDDWEYTDTGKIATNKTARNRLKRHGIELEQFDQIEEYQRLEKYISTYIEPLEAAPPHALCPNYDPLKETGRSGSYNPNIQNFPKRNWGKEIRTAFEPRDGFKYVTADWSTIELRCLAQICLNIGLESEMAKALREGRDLHLDFASHLRGIEYTEALERYEAGDKDITQARTTSKISNYGFPGGLSASAFVLYAMSFGEEISEEKSRELRQNWLNRWPEVDGFFDWVSRQEVRDGGYPIKQHAPGGDNGPWRERYCPKWTVGCNTLFQGMAADGAKFALIELAKRCYVNEDSALYGSRPAAFIHDEVLLEAPRDRAREAAVELHEVMCKKFKIMLPDIPVQADVEVGEKWGKGEELDLARVE